jgi:predicted nucleic acid-binding Zn ribbon protein
MSGSPHRRRTDGNGDLEELDRRGQLQRRRFFVGQPKSVADVMAQLVQRKGYAQVRIGCEMASAWRAAAGDAFAETTEPGQFRRGVLEVMAANSLVMQELAFEKERLLAAMQRSLPNAGIKQLRFRVGQIRPTA